MSGPTQQGTWQEARAPDGRAYYYNTQTKETSWTKPQDMMTPVERALAKQPWKEHTAPDGRKYYAHNESKQTVWEMPSEYKQALGSAEARLPPTPTGPREPAFVAGSSNALQTYQPYNDPSNYEAQREKIKLPTLSKDIIPEYNSFEEAEAAFLKMLKRSNVQADWTWEQTLRATIKDPQYRSLKDPKDRKAAFDKYSYEVREQEKDKAKDRMAKLRTDFLSMLKTHDEIKHYSRWATIRPNLQGETVFRSTTDEEERKYFFAEYILELKKQNIENEVSAHRSAVAELGSIFRSLQIDASTKWSQ
ncbi:U1 snRNP protein, partial [Elasticomyces elasticus]